MASLLRIVTHAPAVPAGLLRDRPLVALAAQAVRLLNKRPLAVFRYFCGVQAAESISNSDHD
jgi:hypothetical protein